ncbi:hypothetical protein Golax_025178 [Gossypium laxum]|uniref:Uncharacterized protein n=1 Tax=Gossypium laxum TaxID=34288 RepID=A0A7J8ZG11_9ROSI|nr:hypothetical protein [Gossypium laxum]
MKDSLAWEKGFRKVVTESDNDLLIDLIGSGYVANSKFLELQLMHDLYLSAHAQSTFEDDAHRALEVIGHHQANYN